MRTVPPKTFQLVKPLNEFLFELAAVSSNSKLIVAVSGGIDSILLANLLPFVQIKPEVTIAHFDHQLRSNSSKDAKFVETQASKLGYKFELGIAIDAPGKENLESWARDRRYAFLESVRRKLNADWILTAHNLNDQVETLLMRTINGRLATRSYGIARIDIDRQIARPILSASRNEVEAVVEELGLDFREDPSNTDLNRSRNKIRHELIPLLATQYNPRLLESLGQLSNRLSSDEEYLWSEAEKIFSSASSWNYFEFLELPSALRWRVLSCWSKNNSGLELKEHRDIGFRALNLATNLIAEKPKDPFSMDLGACIRVIYSPKNGPKFEFYQHRAPSEGAQFEG